MKRLPKPPVKTDKDGPFRLDPPDSHRLRRILKLVIKIITFLVGILILLIVSLVLYFVFGNALHSGSQHRAFNLAVQQCGQQPVVVVHSHNTFIEVTDNYDLYTPLSPAYNDSKAINQNDIFGSAKVILYACSLDEAKTKFNHLGIHGTLTILDDNYSQTAKKAQTDKIIASLQAEGVKLYAPSEIPPDFDLKEKKYDAINKTYSYGYLKKGTRHTGDPIIDGVYLGCQPKSDYTALTSNYTPDQPVGTNQLGGVIYFEQNYAGDNRYNTLLGNTWCQLVDGTKLLSQVQAIQVLSTLQEQPLQELQDFNILGYSDV